MFDINKRAERSLLNSNVYYIRLLLFYFFDKFSYNLNIYMERDIDIDILFQFSFVLARLFYLNKSSHVDYNACFDSIYISFFLLKKKQTTNFKKYDFLFDDDDFHVLRLFFCATHNCCMQNVARTLFSSCAMIIFNFTKALKIFFLFPIECNCV